ncbi:MAG: outer membrane protein assembly factor BamD [Rhizobiales bacterium]|nr:outer membrane protein assembly factor BamD [Hyphomicrobiales bacterium]
MTILESLRRAAGTMLTLAVLATSVSGCAGGFMDGLLGDDDSSTRAASIPNSTGAVSPDLGGSKENDAVAKLYNDGLAKLQNGEYKSATKQFSEVERQYPYSKWATKAILMQAYSDYQRGSPDDAINACNRFITLHPGHKDAPYAYYLIAVSNYNRINDTKRDQRATQQALDALEEVQRRFPGTAYANDAGKKVLMARDHLAGKEMEIGRYYYTQGSYLAGINRFKRVVMEYQKTSQTPEALYRLSEGYMALGVVSEAQTAAAVLGHNYPNSEWYKDAYTIVSSDGQAPVENEKSWISKAFSALNPL